MTMSTSWPGAAMALMSAALFGASTPLVKRLLADGVAKPSGSTLIIDRGDAA